MIIQLDIFQVIQISSVDLMKLLVIKAFEMCKNKIPYIKSSRPMKLKQDAVSGKKKEKINLDTNK